MKTYFLLILSVLSAFFYAQNMESAVDAIIKREMVERKIPGVQIAVVQDGKIILKKTYGIANIQDHVLVTDTTIFPINSCTKVFTATAIMQLMEEGKVDLSAPISTYLDDLDLPEQWKKVTVEQMMTHISGFPDILNVLDPNTGNTTKTEKEIWEELKKRPMVFKTGEQFSYNQTNYYLLGKIIEKLTGGSFEKFFKNRQFQPVGMTHTLFGDSRDVIPHFAPTYRYRNNGKIGGEGKWTNDYYIFPDFTRTGAGINSTAEDLAKWILDLQNGKLLKTPEALNRMWSPIKMNNGTPTVWAPGWGLAKFRTKHRALGMSGGGRSAFLVYPDDHLAIIVLTNLGGSTPEDFLEELAGVYNPDIIKADPVTFLRLNLKKMGFDKAIELVNSEKKKNPDFKPQEFELNEWGYRMMSKNELKNASEIFKLNVYLFPNSSNAYDSYGEVLLKLGDKDQSIKMYQKSIELNPDNENGKEVLKKLTLTEDPKNSK
ncbi:serine hydrolase [Chryseobacterium paridis]|uniref:Class A beta-lactamase-related serine hydrolase n=1 Tax=Chryseobacterium paridis TaxID=2800328 RepID=A0ABS1FUJ9_9FLAO|nr:serine hydrolase [Chryseobacterium paridis]MBK1896099.1 class A beta-lactamase-related serine hydrolase [Chryseobacterium paridis]